MSKSLLIPFLTEWLVKFGTAPVGMTEFGVFNMNSFYKAMRKGYIEQVNTPQHASVTMKLTKEGIRYLQENQK